MTDLRPQGIVTELDKYVIGQQQAKRAVVAALRNSERYSKLPPEIRSEITPKNILMIGPTGVGKTEIARRVASLIKAPFLKVEATKFTEVGYVGRDVDSIISDLVENSIRQIQQKKLAEVESKAEKIATERIVNSLCRKLAGGVGRRLKRKSKQAMVKPQGLQVKLGATAEEAELHLGMEMRQMLAAPQRSASVRRFVTELLRSRQLEDEIIEIEVAESFTDVDSRLPGSEFDELEDLEESLVNRRSQRRWRKVSVEEARRILTREEASKLIDFDQIVDEGIALAEEKGVVFIDEMDKLIGPRIEVGRDISGEGVQRDLLPLLEGTKVMTRYGPVDTQHILFIAAGAFYHGKPSDLIPELQGRFPLRVELNPLSQQDLERILVEPPNALTKQYQALLGADGLKLTFTPDGVREIARMASLMNERIENIGARRLHTIMEKVLEEASFSAPGSAGEELVVDAAYVRQHVGELVKNEDLSRYIL